MKQPQLIFYLDDDSDDLYFFQKTAESLGHTVVTFTDGHAMLQSLRNRDQQPDVIFLDVHMPILNGEEILNVIKKNDALKHIPIVMISGAYPKKLVRHFLEAGANYLMKKPSGNDLKDAIEQVLKINWNSFQAFA